MSKTYKCLVCSEWHAMQEPVTFGGIEIRECPNIKDYFPNTNAVAFDLNQIQYHPALSIPDFGEPKKFL